MENILNKVVKSLNDIEGIEGIVLGGSRARGTHSPDSDIDIVIYYNNKFDLEKLKDKASSLDDEKRENLITNLGEWGNWVNGGGWLIIDGIHVDILFRDIDRVSEYINDCINGKITSHYQTGHPHAYLNSMYVGELAICKILFDPTRKIESLKKQVIPYPVGLKKALIDFFTFEANFSLMFAKSNMNKDDLYYVSGHCFRSVSAMNQVLFAKNNEFIINEKKAVKMIDKFDIKPNNYKKRVDEVFSRLNTNVNELESAIKSLEELVNDATNL